MVNINPTNKIIKGLVCGAIIGTSVGVGVNLFNKPKRKRKRDTVIAHTVIGPLLDRLRPFRLFVPDEYKHLLRQLKTVLKYEQVAMSTENMHSVTVKIERAVCSAHKTLAFFRIKLAQSTRQSNEHLLAFDEVSLDLSDLLDKIYKNTFVDKMYLTH